MGADISQFHTFKQKPSLPAPNLVISSDESHDHFEQDHGMPVKSHSSYTHFSDYSMFPDRFNEKSSGSSMISVPEADNKVVTKPAQDQPFHYSDYSLYPDKFDEKNNAKRLPVQTGLLGGRYNFRLRRSSENAPVVTENDEEIRQHQQQPSSSQGGEHRARARTLSNSRMYYFDFSLIPDKDPHCALDERQRKKSGEEQKPKSPRIAQMMDEQQACAGTSAPMPNSMEEALAKKAKRVRNTSEPKFGFFDYSMIPDKDPRLFRPKEK